MSIKATTFASPNMPAPLAGAASMRTFCFLLAVPVLLSGCKKEPGPGGLAQIRGTVMRQNINNATQQPEGAPYAFPEAKVYIRYGDHDYFDDKTDTNPNGLFTFSWLRTGSYTVFVYSA